VTATLALTAHSKATTQWMLGVVLSRQNMDAINSEWRDIKLQRHSVPVCRVLAG
jgi:hypothetical protein